jgi:transposase-like protein
MDGKVLGIERRRRWSKDEKSRIVEETLAPGAVGERGRSTARGGAEPALHMAKAGAHGGTGQERRLDFAA